MVWSLVHWRQLAFNGDVCWAGCVQTHRSKRSEQRCIFHRLNPSGIGLTNSQIKISHMIALGVSVAMFLLSPVLFLIAIQFKKIWSVIEALLAVGIVAIVVLQLIPESINLAGWSTLLFAFAGLFLPSLLERLWKNKAHSIHFAALLVGILGLAFHGVLDGMALALSSQQGNWLLPFTIILHNLPLGIVVYAAFYEEHGFKLPFVFTMAFIVAMISGFFAGEHFFALRQNIGFVGFFQAFFSGSLLHVIFDRHDEHHDH